MCCGNPGNGQVDALEGVPKFLLEGVLGERKLVIWIMLVTNVELGVRGLIGDDSTGEGDVGEENFLEGVGPSVGVLAWRERGWPLKPRRAASVLELEIIRAASGCMPSRSCTSAERRSPFWNVDMVSPKTGVLLALGAWKVGRNTSEEIKAQRESSSWSSIRQVSVARRMSGKISAEKDAAEGNE